VQFTKNKQINYLIPNVLYLSLGLVKDDDHNRDEWRSLTNGISLTLPHCGNEGVTGPVWTAFW